MAIAVGLNSMRPNLRRGKMKEKSDVEKTAAKAGEIMFMPDVKEYLQTGCTVLDLAIANVFPGGIPIGRIVQFYGGFSTCKSVLASLILGYAIRSKRDAYYGDIEHTLEPGFANLFGLDFSKLANLYDFEKETFPATIEEFFDVWLSNIIYKDAKHTKLNMKPKVIVTDTITALPAKFEDITAMDKQGYGAYRAKQLSLGYRKYIRDLARSNTTLVIIDQTRDKFGSAFGGESVPGGRGPEYYPSVRVSLKKGGKILNAAGAVIGIWVRFIVTKNKVGPPFREGRFKILFNHSLDDIDSNLYFLSERQNGPDKAKNKTQTMQLWGKEPHTRKYWINKIEEESLEAKLREVVWDAYQEYYKTAPRKSRTW